jgi:predicted metal-dependent enzyme (double-stranded beta helix superfamily)
MGRDDRNRNAAISETLSEIRDILSGGVTVDRLDRAKSALLRLCGRTDLFNFDIYPLPSDGGIESTYFIHCDPDGTNALYVSCARPGMSYRPHNHGGSWAIIGGVQGRESHRMFTETGDAAAPIDQRATLMVHPGHAVSMMPDGIHAIAVEGDEPILNLHLYGSRFENQQERSEFDEATGERFVFRLENVGEIVDCR